MSDKSADPIHEASRGELRKRAEEAEYLRAVAERGDRPYSNRGAYGADAFQVGAFESAPLSGFSRPGDPLAVDLVTERCLVEGRTRSAGGGGARARSRLKKLTQCGAHCSIHPSMICELKPGHGASFAMLASAIDARVTTEGNDAVLHACGECRPPGRRGRPRIGADRRIPLSSSVDPSVKRALADADVTSAHVLSLFAEVIKRGFDAVQVLEQLLRD